MRTIRDDPRCRARGLRLPRAIRHDLNLQSLKPAPSPYDPLATPVCTYALGHAWRERSRAQNARGPRQKSDINLVGVTTRWFHSDVYTLKDRKLCLLG